MPMLCPHCKSELKEMTSNHGWGKCPKCVMWVSAKTAKVEKEMPDPVKSYSTYIFGKDAAFSINDIKLTNVTVPAKEGHVDIIKDVPKGEMLPPLPPPTKVHPNVGKPSCNLCAEECSLLKSEIYGRTMWACNKCQRWVARQFYDTNDNAANHQKPDMLHPLPKLDMKSVKLVWQDGTETKAPDILPPVVEVDPRKRKFR